MAKAALRPAEETVSLRLAKATLSSLTKQARAGTRIVITSHGTAVADLVAHGTGATPPLRFKRPGPLPKPIRMKGSGPTLSELVLMDRAG
jgi:antitoxin (DNA-binding transcriptional repressor) of toxin-antitoxin stability system